jgi:hypothetical protein
MSTYASQSSVSAEKSKAEIEKTLQRFGADQFGYGWEDMRAIVVFRAKERTIRFVLELPDKNDPKFARTPTGLVRSNPDAILKAWEQETRSAWRALTLVIKSKLVAVEQGIVTFEQEFLAHIVLPDGGTVGEWIAPQIERSYESGDMPLALPGG